MFTGVDTYTGGGAQGGHGPPVDRRVKKNEKEI